MRKIFFAVVLIIILLASKNSYAKSYDFLDLGTLDGVNSLAWDINDNGQVTGTYIMSNGWGRGFFYDSSMHDIGNLGGDLTEARAINNNGQIVGYTTTADYSRAHSFLYDGSMHDIGTLGGERNRGNGGFGINDFGYVVGVSETVDNAVHAYFYDGNMHDIGTLGGRDSEGWDINNSGQIVGRSQFDSSSAFHAFFYENGIMTDLGTFGGYDTRARAINNLGQIVGTSNLIENGSAAFFYDGTMHNLGTLGTVASDAWDINDAGQIVGRLEGSINAAFLYENGTMYNLNDFTINNKGASWLTGAYGINELGQIVGSASVNGMQHAFLLTPNVVPEPASMFLFGVGGLVLAALKRKRL